MQSNPLVSRSVVSDDMGALEGVGPNVYRNLAQLLTNVTRNLGHRPMRSRKYSRSAAIRFVEIYVEQGSIRAAANEFGVHRSCVYEWLHRHREFQVMMRIGRQALEVSRSFEQREFEPEALKQHQRLSRHLRRVLRVPKSGDQSRSWFRPIHCGQVGSTWRETAERIGIHRQTVAGWCRRHPEFARAQFLARARRKIERFDELLTKLERRA